MCQCPERGDLHFYVFTERFLKCSCQCVNALKGATFISTLSKFPGIFISYRCQCPERGALHFYTADTGNSGTTAGMCQCPERGDLHFYKVKAGCHALIVACVNALKGATFISTEKIMKVRELLENVSMP